MGCAVMLNDFLAAVFTSLSLPVLILQGGGLPDICSRGGKQWAGVQCGGGLHGVRTGCSDWGRSHEIQGRQPCADLCWRKPRLPVCAGGQQLIGAMERC